MSTAAFTSRPADLPRMQMLALSAGVAGVVLCLVGAVSNPGQFFQSYLVAYCFLLGLGAGSLAVLMLQHLTGGGWGLVLRRPLEAGTRTLPLLAVLFVPLIFGLDRLYPWSSPGEVSPEKAAYYLNIPFFLVRMAFYFVVWITLAVVLNRMSKREDETAANDPGRRFRLLSARGLGLYGLTMSFAAIDLGMSLEPKWYSTMYPPLWAFGQLLTAFCFMITVVILMSGQAPLQGFLQRGHLRDLGSLLLAFVMIWAYLAFSQYLLVWSANLKEEVGWFEERMNFGWQGFAIALILGHFVLPFMLLLSGDVKRHGGTLAAVAGLVVLMRYVDMYWVIKPAFQTGFAPLWLWLDVSAVVALGGVWLAFFLWQLQRMPLLPVHDYRLLEMNNHHG